MGKHVYPNPVTVRVSDEMMEYIEERCLESNMGLSDVVRALLYSEMESDSKVVGVLVLGGDQYYVFKDGRMIKKDGGDTDES